MKNKKKKREKGTTNNSLPEVLPINLNELEIEWVNQPELCGAYCRALANTEFDLDEAQSDLELFSAEIELKIRGNQPEKYGLEKFTEGAIKSILIQKKKYQQLHKVVLGIHHKIRLLKGVLKKIDQRRKGLEKVVDLHGQEYFSVPRAPEHSRERMEAATKRSVRKQTKRK